MKFSDEARAGYTLTFQLLSWNDEEPGSDVLKGRINLEVN